MAPRTQLGFIWQPSRPRPCQRELGLGPYLSREEQEQQARCRRAAGFQL